MKKQGFGTLAVIVVALIAFSVFSDTKGTPGGSGYVTDTPTSTATSTGTSEPVRLATFTMGDVSSHGTALSCYTAVRGNVYDLTSFIAKHPGGEGKILSICGKDGTAAFEAQHGGRSRPEATLDGYKIGTLTQ